MVRFDRAAYAFLSALPVTGSPLVAMTVDWLTLPEDPSFPALIFESEAEHEAIYTGPSGRALRTLRMTLFGYDGNELDGIAEQLRLGIHGSAVWTDVFVQCHSFSQGRPMKDPEPDTDFLGLIQIPLVAEMWVTENTS